MTENDLEQKKFSKLNKAEYHRNFYLCLGIRVVISQFCDLHIWPIHPWLGFYRSYLILFFQNKGERRETTKTMEFSAFALFNTVIKNS